MALSQTDSNQDIQSVAFISLGCPKNTVDSEKMLGLLAEDGVAPVHSDDPADAVIINTCGFLEASKDESLDEIHQALARKEAGEVKRVVVAGCLVQRHRAKILEWAPGVDAMIGVFDRDKVIEAVRGPQTSTGKDIAIELPVFSSIAANATIAKEHRKIEEDGYYEDDSARLRITPRHYTYLRMSEGCNQNCAFCTIPSIRGKMRSKPIDRIVAELRELIQDGAFEISLIGQDTTSYGEDIGYEGGLEGLLETLNKTVNEEVGQGNAWIRLMYAYPSSFSDAMVDAIAKLPNIVKYIDMPLQHINDEVLDNMRRRTGRELITTLLGKLRDRIPGMAVRTTFISGFPGETEEQHQELVQFVREFGFEQMGVFPYSPEPNTPAGTMHAQGGAINPEVIDRRIEELMLAQQEVVFERNEKDAESGRQFPALIDELIGEDEEGLYIYNARGPHQAPDIDAQTLVRTKQDLAPGEVVQVTVTAYQDYDQIAVPTDDLSTDVSLNII